MYKQEFLTRLRNGLQGLPQEDIEERVTFYSEMIDDRMEEGLSEQEAVNGIGPVDDIIAQIVGDVPLAKIVKERITPKQPIRGWEIALLVLGSPVWFSLLIAAISVVFAIYVSLWSVIISLWAVFVALLASGLGVVAAGIWFAVSGNVLIGTAAIGAGIVCVGLSVFMFFGCKAATKGILLLTKKIALWIKNCFMKKERV